MVINTIEESEKKNFKIKIFRVITLFFTLTLVIRLFYLQVFSYKNLTQRAQYSTSSILVHTAPRGIIYDRNGKILATNKQSISAVVYPDKLKTRKQRFETYLRLTRILKANSKNLKETFLKLPKSSALPIRLQSNLSTEEAIKIVENQHLLPGINIQKEPVRFYPNGELAAHVIGYISEINEDELNKNPERKLGDTIGKYGLESLFDDLLRGKDGKTIVEVDRFGNPIDPDYKNAVIHVDPVPGKNLKLTIDSDLQKVTEEALKNLNANSGAVVVDPLTGEILALASYPTFNPNLFTTPFTESAWRNLLSKKPFINRALVGYVPGSIWKPITAIAALDAMVIKPGERFKVSEAVYLGKTRFGDWTDKEGVFSLEDSLAWSRDTAFYQIGKRLTPKQIKQWGVKLGAGRKTGIELAGEESGIVPDEEWKKKNLNEPWYPGNTLHYSIGQSFLLITPVQAARIYSALATGSKIPRLYIVNQIDKNKKRTPVFETFTLNPELLKAVTRGLEKCVEEGTGQAAKLEKIKVAGKTGSAEVPGTGKTHGWFAAYAPAEKPEIVVIVISEKAGHGGTIAAPVAKKILEGYFNSRKSTILAKQ